MNEKNKFNISKDILKAQTLDSNYYLNNKIFEETVYKIFSSSWHFVAHRKELENYKVVPVDIRAGSIKESLLLILENESVSCLSNVCTHRGHQICSNKGNQKLLRCKYHGRTYNLDGTINKAPGFENQVNFLNQDNLCKIKTIEWKDYIFISLGEKSIDISSIFKDINSRIPNYPFNKLTFSEDLSNSFEINSHWSLYCENYLEGLHVPFVHKGLNKNIDIATYKTELLDNGVVQYAKSSDRSNDIYGYYYWIFPNIMINFYQWGISMNIVEPINTTKTRIRFLSFPININNKTKKHINELVNVEHEDQKVVESVQNGIQSRYYKRGSFSKDYEKGPHYFHFLLSKYL